MSSLNTGRNLEDCCNAHGPISILDMCLREGVLDFNIVSIALLDLTICVCDVLKLHIST